MGADPAGGWENLGFFPCDILFSPYDYFVEAVSGRDPCVPCGTKQILITCSEVRHLFLIEMLFSYSK